MSRHPMPVRWILPLAVVGSLLTICAVGVRDAHSAGGSDQEWELEPVYDEDEEWDLGWDSDSDTDTDMLDTDTDMPDTDPIDSGFEDDTDVLDTAEPSAAELAGEAGGLHCATASPASLSPLAAWPALLFLLAVRRRS